MSLPKAAWLKKKTCTMGKTRWQSRFFVLLETELRYYKDEYAVAPKYIWNLQEMVNIQQYKTVRCLSLEPLSHSNHKTLEIQFPSEYEMQEWLVHLVARCSLPSSLRSSPSSSSSISRRRGIILSSLAIPNNEVEDDHEELLPSLVSPLSSTISTSSSSSSITTLVQKDEPPLLPMKDMTLDETASPTYLKYKNQFRL